jgi:dihydrofolate reductase
MGNVVVSEFVSLDGVMEAPERWTSDFWCDEIAAFKFAEAMEAGALLLGRSTYEIFAGSWPTRAGDTFADQFNALPNYVVSSTLTNPTWNASVIADAKPETIGALRTKTDGTLLVHGSATLVASLIEHDLVDEYRLLTYPVVLGDGMRLFPASRQVRLALVESRPFRSGAVLLTYRRPSESDTPT